MTSYEFFNKEKFSHRKEGNKIILWRNEVQIVISPKEIISEDTYLDRNYRHYTPVALSREYLLHALNIQSELRGRDIDLKVTVYNEKDIDDRKVFIVGSFEKDDYNRTAEDFICSYNFNREDRVRYKLHRIDIYETNDHKIDMLEACDNYFIRKVKDLVVNENELPMKPPTSEEVSEELEKWFTSMKINSSVKYEKETFYLGNNLIVFLDNSGNICFNTNRFPKHLVILIGRFYKGLK